MTAKPTQPLPWSVRENRGELDGDEIVDVVITDANGFARDGVTVDERQVRRALAALVARDAARKTPGTPPRYLPVALYDGEPREVAKS